MTNDTPNRIAHVGVAVPDLTEASRFYRDILGLTPSETETADGAEIVHFRFGGVDVELLAPRDPEGPISSYLKKRGPGIHHICFRVPDLDAALARCRAAGYRLVDELPRRGAGGKRIAFVHPKATAGILLELTE